MIGFNKPYLTGKELEYIATAVAAEKISGDGIFTRKCHDFFCRRYGFAKVLLTTSGTDALEMAALLCGIQPGDEVIVPAYTFVSTANAFALRGAQIVFADSRSDHPCLDVSQVEPLISSRTKAIVVVHYGGVAVNMEPLMALAEKHRVVVIEDAAQAIDSYYRQQPLGGIGHLAAFSFHETKNVMCGEGGMLVINDSRFGRRAEILREKGTNRSAFFRGEVDKYTWIDLGSSFLPSDLLAAFLYAQLENLEKIQKQRQAIWKTYHQALHSFLADKGVQTPVVPPYASNNAHLYYLVFPCLEQRDRFIEYMRAHGVQVVFHYLALHQSPYYVASRPGPVPHLPEASRYADCLVRLPLYFELNEQQLSHIVEATKSFFVQASGDLSGAGRATLPEFSNKQLE